MRDVAHTTRLLWRALDGPARGPKQGLDVDAITRAATAIADRGGLAKLSMRAVAESLGVATMSLYTYVPGKADVIDLMADAAYMEVVDSPPPPTPWRTGLARVAHDNLALFERHPWLVELPQARAGVGPGAVRKFERELAPLDGIGLTDLEMDGVLALVLGHAHGVAARAQSAARTRRETGLDDRAWWDAVAPVLAEVLTEPFPLGERVGMAAGQAYDAAEAPDHGFAFGLERILDGVERLVAGRC